MQSVSIFCHCQSSSDPLVDMNTGSIDVQCSMLVSVLNRLRSISSTHCDVTAPLTQRKMNGLSLMVMVMIAVIESL